MCDGDSATIRIGTLVRIKTDPGRIGVVGTRIRELGDGSIWQQVRFPDGSQYLRPGQLEEVGDDDEDPLDLLAAGKFGRSKDLRTLLTHIRLSGRLANLIYSMETTNTDFYPYQFKPVLNFLDSPSGGLLIADEVGLGKTIEAGLIWTELRSRFDSRKLMILCPAVLREKWREELHNRFGIDAEVVTAEETCKRLSEVREGRRAQVHMIGSLQGLSPRRGWSDEQSPSDSRGKLARLMSAAQYDEPMLDLVVIDEAHYMRNPETMSAALGRLLRGVTEHIVLLSATPVHLHSGDLYQLLNLVDEDTFNDQRVFEEILEANIPLLEAKDLVQSSRQDPSDIEALLSKAAEHPFLKNNRQLADIRHSLRELDLREPETRARLANRMERLNLLGHAVTRTRKREVTEWRVVREAVAETVTLHPAERQFYDRITDLVRDYCERREAHEGFLLVTPQRQVSSSMAAALRDWQRRAELARDDLEDYLERDDEPAMHFGPIVGELLFRAREMGDLEELYAVDTKYRRLASMLTEYLTEHPREKIILFSTFKATLRYLNERLSQDGIESMLLMGGIGMDKHEAIRKFHEMPHSCVLLASEVASEGVDLQFARVLVNYDLPWNPMKVEQRIGRIDRIGQHSPKITIWNMLHDETIDQRIHSRLYQRLGIFERALGGLEVVLGGEVRKLTMDLMRSAITPQQEAKRIEQTVNAVAIVQNMEADLEDKAANLVAHGEYILNQVSAARQMNRWISGEDLTAYVLDYFNTHYQGSTFRQKRSDALTFDIRLDEQARYDLEQFTSRNRLQGVTRLATNAAGPVECEFKNRVSTAKGIRTEVISQFHPLVRFVSHGIREKGERFHANVSTRISRTFVPSVAVGRYVFVVDHWSLKGLRDIERINFVVASLDTPFRGLDSNSSELVISQAALHGADWLAAGNSLDLRVARQVTEVCLQRSIEDYDQFVSQMVDENNDRADLQSESLKKYSDRQLNQLRRIRELHKTLGRDNLVRATEGRIVKLEERVTRKSKDIQSRRGLVHNRREVCVGVIEVA